MNGGDSYSSQAHHCTRVASVGSCHDALAAGLKVDCIADHPYKGDEIRLISQRSAKRDGPQSFAGARGIGESGGAAPVRADLANFGRRLGSLAQRHTVSHHPSHQQPTGSESQEREGKRVPSIIRLVFARESPGGKGITACSQAVPRTLTCLFPA
jgi:hypothetical protein